MALLMIVIIAGGIFYFVKIRPPLQPFEINVEEAIVFVGRVVAWSPRVGLVGGKKVMLYKKLPARAHFSDGEFRSDGSINGDLNRIYRAFKQSAKDVLADYEIHSSLSFSLGGLNLTPLTEFIEIPSDVLERQKSLTEQCRFGDQVTIRVHTYAFRRRPDVVKKDEQLLTWIELVVVRSAEANIAQ